MQTEAHHQHVLLAQCPRRVLLFGVVVVEKHAQAFELEQCIFEVLVFALLVVGFPEFLGRHLPNLVECGARFLLRIQFQSVHLQDRICRHCIVNLSIVSGSKAYSLQIEFLAFFH